MITAKEIARHCNVSPSTVSNILNGKSNVGEQTRRKVLDYIRKTGYQPNYFAQNIRKQRSRTISIITEDLSVFGTNPIVESVMAYCEDQNYRTILMNLRLYSKWLDTWYYEPELVKESLSPILQEASSIKVCGIIYVAGHCRVIDYFPQNFPIPVVITYGIAKDNKYPSVIIDDEKGGYDTARYLISKGHNNIGVIAGAPDNLHTINRLLGLQKALFDEHIPYNPDLIYYGDWKRQSGYDGAEHLVRKGITALFCMNDKMAGGAYDFLNSSGLSVGKDISIIGYDNMELSDYMQPQLTTNGIQLSDIGEKSAEIMIQSLKNTEDTKKEATTIKMPCKIVERESVCNINI